MVTIEKSRINLTKQIMANYGDKDPCQTPGFVSYDQCGEIAHAIMLRLASAIMVVTEAVKEKCGLPFC
jgi:hypothetical protein